MSEKVSHYIITKYNLSLYSEWAARPNKVADPDAWMEYRYKLFTNFTFPSMQGQRCQDFTWYLLMDRQTPRQYKEQLEDLAFSNMRIVYLKGGQCAFLQNEIKGGRDIVITSRVDNDDAWHRDYVKVIQTEYAKPTRLIEYAESYWLDITTKEIYRRNWRWYYRLKPSVGNNPTMIEWRDRAKTVLAAPHPKLVKQVKWYQFKKITKKPYRLIVCHEQNLVNKTSDMIAKATKVTLDVLDDFDIKLDMLGDKDN